MKWLALTFLLTACAPQHLRPVAPADTTKSHTDAFMALAVSALIVLVLIPILAGAKD